MTSQPPEGRKPLTWSDLIAPHQPQPGWKDIELADRPKGHPSTEMLEIGRLKERVQKLEAALSKLVDTVAILPPEYDEPGSAIHQARAVMREGQQR